MTDINGIMTHSSPWTIGAALFLMLLLLWWHDVGLRCKLWIRRYVFLDKMTPRLPPGNFGWPVVGHIPNILWLAWKSRGKNKNVLGEYQIRQAARYGKIRLGSLPPLGSRFVCVSDPECLAWIFRQENKGVAGRLDKATANLLGENSLVFLTGVHHKRMRAALQHLFQPSFLNKYCQRMNEIVTDHLKKHWVPTGGFTKTRIAIQDEMKLLTFKIISDVILGVDHEQELDTVKRLIELMQTWFGGLLMPTTPFPGSPYPKAMRARDEIKSILLPKIQQARARQQQQTMTANNSTNKSDIALELLVSPIRLQGNEVQNLTDNQIFDSLLVLLFAGSDTSTVSMTWIVKRLLENPDVLMKLRQEHLELLQKRGRSSPSSSTTFITMEEISTLEYTNQVIFESLRLVNPAPQLFRGITQDLVYKGYLFPKGYRVFLEVAHAIKHNSVATKGEEETFDPERFKTNSNLGALKLPGFQPFGGGARLCLGYRLAIAELNTFLHHFILGFDFEVTPEASDKTSYFPMPLPEDGLPVYVSPAASAMGG